MSHALLSPSSSERWINCPPSAKENTGSENGSSYAQQGTDAHTLCEFKVNQALGHKVRDPTENLTYFDDEMADCTDGVKIPTATRQFLSMVHLYISLVLSAFPLMQTARQRIFTLITVFTTSSTTTQDTQVTSKSPSSQQNLQPKSSVKFWTITVFSLKRMMMNLHSSPSCLSSLATSITSDTFFTAALQADRKQNLQLPRKIQKSRQTRCPSRLLHFRAVLSSVRQRKAPPILFTTIGSRYRTVQAQVQQPRPQPL